MALIPPPDIIAAAAQALLRTGFKNVDMATLQQLTGIPPEHLSAWFPDSNSLLQAVVCHESQRFAAVIQSSTPDAQLRDMLESTGRAYLAISLAADMLTLLRHIISVAPHHPELASTFYLASSQQIARYLAQQLDRARQRRQLQIAEGHTESAACQFIALLHSESLPACLLQPDYVPDQTQQEQWLKRSVDLFCRAYPAPE